MKTKQEFEKAIADTQQKYKDIILGNDTPVCAECLNELKKQQVIDEKVHDQNLIENTTKKLTLGSLRKSSRW